ncbi:MAG: hypothetical protein ACKPKO_07365, partial [Candidatus Fonsibacter sp.]
MSKLISSADLAPSESASADDRLRTAPVLPDRGGGGVPNDVIDQADHKNASSPDVYHIDDTIDTHYPFHDNLRRIVQGLQLRLGQSIVLGLCNDAD